MSGRPSRLPVAHRLSRAQARPARPLILTLALALAGALATPAAAAVTTTPLPDGWVTSILGEADGSTRLLNEPPDATSPFSHLLVPPTGPVQRTDLLEIGRGRRWATGALLPGGLTLLADETRHINATRHTGRVPKQVRVILLSPFGQWTAPVVISRPRHDAVLDDVQASPSGAAAVLFHEPVGAGVVRHWVALRGPGPSLFARAVRVAGADWSLGAPPKVLYNAAGDGLLVAARGFDRGIVVQRITRAGQLGAPIVITRHKTDQLNDVEALSPDGAIAVSWFAERTIARHRVTEIRVSTVAPGRDVPTSRPALRVERHLYTAGLSAAWVGKRLLLGGYWWFDVAGRPTQAVVRVYDATGSGAPTLVHSEPGQGGSQLEGIEIGRAHV